MSSSPRSPLCAYLAVALVTACGTVSDPEARVSISRGVYGQITCEAPEFDECGVSAHLELHDLRGDLVAELSPPSNDPFFEIPLENGTYRICARVGRCGPFFDITDGAPLIRCDMQHVDSEVDLLYYCAPRGEW